jgi:hypothetical protein
MLRHVKTQQIYLTISSTSVLGFVQQKKLEFLLPVAAQGPANDVEQG